MQVGFGGEKPPRTPAAIQPRSHPLVMLHPGGVCQACSCLLCQVKSRHYNTCMHVFVRAVEPVKCGTIIPLQQIDMSADSARQCEQSERLLLLVCIVGLASCSVTMQSTVSLATILHKRSTSIYIRQVELLHPPGCVGNPQAKCISR